MIKKYHEQQEEKLLEIYLLSVWTSRWVWAKKIPKFNEIIGKLQQNEPMTVEQMAAQIKALNALFGGEVRVVGKE